MKVKLNGLFIICLILSSSLLFAQKKGQVEGLIKDVQTGQVLPYASVFLKGLQLVPFPTTKGTIVSKLLRLVLIN